MIFIYPDGGTTTVSADGYFKGIRRLGQRPQAVQLNWQDLNKMLEAPSLLHFINDLRNALAILEQSEQPDGSGTR